MFNKKSIEDVQLTGKKVLMRVDFNVPLEGSRVRDDSRIKAALLTIERLTGAGAKIALVSHLGRPEGKRVESLKMDPVAQRLSELLARPVPKTDDVRGPQFEERVNALKEGELLMLENIRFFPEEESNDPAFAKALSRPFDLFVNDAFGTAHRAHASTVGVAAFIPAVAGLLMKKEIEELSSCLENPRRPLVVILGGAKVSDKINVIRRFLDLADYLLVGGGMANTFLAAQGYSLGASFFEKEQLETAKMLMKQAEDLNCVLLMPRDLVAVEKIEEGALFEVLAPAAVLGSLKAVDIGPETVKEFSSILEKAAMVIWNGPLGVFETPPFDRGTHAVALSVVKSKAYSVIGGGDLVAAIKKFRLSEQISFISTGGGATLEFWEGKELPGIAALQDASF